MAVGWIKLSGVTVWLFIALSQIVHAQIVTDGTLGKAATLSGPNFQLSSEFGKLVGPNQFHSFRIIIIKYRHKITPYAGKKVLGTVEATILRGKRIFDSGDIHGDPVGQPLLKSWSDPR